MQKRFLVLVILLVAVIAAAGAQQTIRIGYWDGAPYVVSQPGGKAPVGAAVDYWTTIIAPAMKANIEWVGPTPMLRLLSQLKSGDIDAVLVIGKNPEREKLYQYPALPFLHYQPGIAMLKENPLAAIKTPGDLSGMKLGTAEGAVVVDFVKNAPVTWDNVTTATWIQDQYTKLANKRIDGVFNLGLEGLQYEASKTYPGRFKFLPIPVPSVDIYTGFAKTDKATAFLKLYNDVNAKNASAVPGLVGKYIN